MASVYDRRMEEIAAQRRRDDGLYHRDDGAPTGSEFMHGASTWLIVGGAILCVTPALPFGMFMLLFGLLLRPAARPVATVESRMSDEVRGEGVTGHSVGWLIFTTLVGFAFIIGAAFVGIMVMLAMVHRG